MHLNLHLHLLRHLHRHFHLHSAIVSPTLHRLPITDPPPANPMDPLWLLLLLPLAAFSGWLTARREQRAATGKHKLPEAYFKGLNFLLNEQPDQAIKVFLGAVAVDNQTLELHLALGSLFRRRGEIERATRIHQNLATRPGLAKRLRWMAMFELAQDYFKAGLLGRAEELFQTIRRTPEHREQANRFLLQIYDQEKEWRNAILIAEELSQTSDLDLSASLAQYCCELAEKAITEGQNQRAADDLQAAFQYDAHCVRAVIQSGRLAAMRGNHANAIAIWRGLEELAPHALGEVIDHIANSYAALGDAENYQRFLESAIQHNANSDWRFIAALAELAKNQQQDSVRHTLLLNLVRKNSRMEELYALLNSAARRRSNAENHQDFTALVALMLQIFGPQRGYHCTHCGFHSNSLHWQCPGCKNWGSVQQRVAASSGNRSEQFGMAV